MNELLSRTLLVLSFLPRVISRQISTGIFEYDLAETVDGRCHFIGHQEYQVQ